MLRRTATVTLTRACMHAILEQATVAGADTVGGPLNGAKYKFHIGENAFGPDSVYVAEDIAALGTAGAAITWAGPLNLDEEKAALKCQAEVIAGAAPDSEDITGIVIVDAAGTELLGGYQFDEVVPIRIEGDAISVDVIIAVPYELASGVAE